MSPALPKNGRTLEAAMHELRELVNAGQIGCIGRNAGVGAQRLRLAKTDSERMSAIWAKSMTDFDKHPYSRAFL